MQYHPYPHNYDAAYISVLGPKENMGKRKQFIC